MNLSEDRKELFVKIDGLVRLCIGLLFVMPMAMFYIILILVEIVVGAERIDPKNKRVQTND